MNWLFRLNSAEGLTLYSMVFTRCLLVLPDKGLHNVYKSGIKCQSTSRMNTQLRSWPLLSKKKKIRGFQKYKVHCCNFKGFKVTSLQSSGTPGFESTPPTWVNFPMLSDSRGWPRIKSWPGWTLKTCNFEALEVRSIYFIFLETSNLFLL